MYQCLRDELVDSEDVQGASDALATLGGPDPMVTATVGSNVATGMARGPLVNRPDWKWSSYGKNRYQYPLGMARLDRHRINLVQS